MQTRRKLIDDTEIPVVENSRTQKGSKSTKISVKRKNEKINFLVSNMPEEYQVILLGFKDIYFLILYSVEFNISLTKLA